MIPNLGSVDAKSIGELTDVVARQTKEIQFILEGNIDADNIRANSITADLIQAGAIISTSIADGSITNTKIANSAIDNAKLIDSTIQGIKLQAGTLTDTQIANLGITGSKIANTTITGNKIVTGTITADKLSVSTLSAITADLGYVSAGVIDGLLITGGTVRTSSGSSRIEITNDKLTGYSGGQTSIELRPDLTNPYVKCGNIYMYDYGITGQASKITIGSGLTLSYSGGSGYTGTIDSAGAIYITAGASQSVYLNGTDVVYSLNGKANTVHTHSISDVSGLQTSLDGKAASSHTHTKSQITDFSHTHSWSDITSGKPTTISGYSISDAFTKSETDSRYGYNLVYNSTTKHLKLYAHDGTTLADVDITGS